MFGLAKYIIGMDCFLVFLESLIQNFILHDFSKKILLEEQLFSLYV